MLQHNIINDCKWKLPHTIHVGVPISHGNSNHLITVSGLELIKKIKNVEQRILDNTFLYIYAMQHSYIKCSSQAYLMVSNSLILERQKMWGPELGSLTDFRVISSLFEANISYFLYNNSRQLILSKLIFKKAKICYFFIIYQFSKITLSKLNSKLLIFFSDKNCQNCCFYES